MKVILKDDVKVLVIWGSCQCFRRICAELSDPKNLAAEASTKNIKET